MTTKKPAMSREAVKDMIYGAMREFSTNTKFWYGGINDDFSHLTPQGEREMLTMFNKFIPMLKRCEDQRIQDMAKRMTWGELGGEDTASIVEPSRDEL